MTPSVEEREKQLHDQQFAKLGQRLVTEKANEIVLGTGCSWEDAVKEALRRLWK